MINAVVHQRGKALRWITSGAVGIAAGWSYFGHFAQQQVTAPLDRGILLIYLALFFAVLVYFILYRFTLPLLRPFSRRDTAACALMTFMLVGFLLAIVPLRVPPGPAYHRLAVVATGEKNPAAKRSEVWVTGLYRADGSQVATTELSLEGAWEIQDDVPVSRQQQPATLRWEGWLAGDAKLEFVSHPWSGIVQVWWDGKPQTVDLYANVDPLDHRVVALAVNTQAAGDFGARLRSIVFVGTDALSIGLLLFAASAWLMAKGRRLSWNISKSENEATSSHRAWAADSARIPAERLLFGPGKLLPSFQSKLASRLSLSLPWGAFALALALAYAGVAVGRVSPSVIYNADALYLPALYHDVTTQQDLSGWNLPPAPYFFPDLPLFFGLNLLLADFRLAILIYGAAQILLFIGGLIGLGRLISFGQSHTDALLLIAGALFFLYFYIAPYPVLALSLVSAHHFGAAVIAIGCLILLGSTLEYDHLDGRVILPILVAILLSTLTVASDMVYIVHFLLPAMLSVCLLLTLSAITPRQALIYGTLCLSLPAGIALNRALVGSSTWAGLLLPDIEQPHIALGQLVSWFEQTRLSHPVLSSIAICFVPAAVLVLATVVRQTEQPAERARRLLVVSFLLYQPLACLGSVLLLGTVNDRYLIPIFTIPTFFGWPLLIVARRPAVVAGSRLGSTALAAVVGLVCLGLLISAGKPQQIRQLAQFYPSFVRCVDDQTRQRGLRNGVSNYWQAKYITLLSQNGVHVVQVGPDLQPFQWINNRHWYDQPFSFIILDTQQAPTFRLDHKTVVGRFGQPDDSFMCDGSEILVYHSPQFRDQFLSQQSIGLRERKVDTPALHVRNRE